MQAGCAVEPGAISFGVPLTKVELSVSAKNLKDKDVTSKSDPVCVLYAVDSGRNQLHELGRTEKISDDLNPQWIKKFEIDYRFEEKQMLQFHVFDWDSKSQKVDDQDKLGFVEVSLGEVMAHGGAPLTRTLHQGHGAMLLVSGEELANSKEVITLNFAASKLDKKDTFGKSDPFLVISRCVGGNNQYSALHRTEYLRKTLDPVWKPIIIPARVLCGGDGERTIKIECFDWDSGGSHDFIGECFTTLNQLKQGNVSSNHYPLINPKKKAKKSSYKDSGVLLVQSCTVHEEPTFLDYIKGGTQLHFTVAVDFTASNGDPRSPSSLHFLHPDAENQYALAIRSVGEIIQDYDTDKQFPALGFGGQVPPHYQVSHEFYLNGRTDSPYCSGIVGVLEAYRHALSTVRLYGPTNFAPVINHVAQFARALQDDLPMTRKALVEASELPMSVIIVGVGNEDFAAMELLDGDDNRLSHNGKYAVRDIVQFVELRRHQQLITSSPVLGRSMLARDVLAEVPLQMVSWMKAHRIPPVPLSGQVQPDDVLDPYRVSS